MAPEKHRQKNSPRSGSWPSSVVFLPRGGSSGSSRCGAGMLDPWASGPRHQPGPGEPEPTPGTGQAANSHFLPDLPAMNHCNLPPWFSPFLGSASEQKCSGFLENAAATVFFLSLFFFFPISSPTACPVEKQFLTPMRTRGLSLTTPCPDAHTLFTPISEFPREFCPPLSAFARNKEGWGLTSLQSGHANPEPQVPKVGRLAKSMGPK